jgi:hypothetical protein
MRTCGRGRIIASAYFTPLPDMVTQRTTFTSKPFTLAVIGYRKLRKSSLCQS